MIVGHAGIALLLRRWTVSRVALPLLLLAGYLPDIWRALLVSAAHESVPQANMLSHSIPAVALQAAILGAIWLISGGGIRGACVLVVAALSHWPADVITGCKPTWPGGPELGLRLYRQPLFDLIVELALVILAVETSRAPLDLGAWFTYSRRRLVLGGLVLVQLVGVGIMAATSTIRFHNRNWQWMPQQGLTHFRPMGTQPSGCDE